MILRNGLVFCALTLCLVRPVIAGTITYSDRSTWIAQVTNLVDFDGGSTPVGNNNTFNNSSGVSNLDLRIVGYNVTTGTSYELQAVNASASQTWYQWGSGAILRTGDKTATNSVYARISFANPVSAFGFNFGGSGGVSSNVTISPAGLTDVTLATLVQPNWTFYGVTSDTQTFTFADVYINDTNRYLVLDNIAYGSAVVQQQPAGPAETAEPGTLLLMAMGGLLFSVAKRGRLLHWARLAS